MKNNKIVFWILLVLVTGIWGGVIIRIVGYEHAKDFDEQRAPVSTPLEQGGKQERYIYMENIRDPFYFPQGMQQSDSLSHKVKPQKPVWTAPPFKLTGIVLTGRRKTVTLEGTNGSVFFLQKGDTLKGMKIMDIDGQSVTYLYQKKKEKWVLQ